MTKKVLDPELELGITKIEYNCHPELDSGSNPFFEFKFKVLIFR